MGCNMRVLIARLGLGSVITLIMVLGAVGLALFVQHEQNRTEQQWREKLDLIASARTREVNGFLQQQWQGLSSLADNAALQIYFTQLQNNQNNDAASGQADYLRNLITLTAERLGFAASAQTLEQRLGANIRALGTGGIALVKLDGHLLMATSAMPEIDDQLRASIVSAPRGQANFLGITQAADGTQRMGFMVPVYAIQAEQTAAAQVGFLLAVRPIDAAFYNLLVAEPAAEKTLEVALVRKEDGNVRYLTPLMDKSPIMSKSEADDTRNAAAYAIAHADNFAEKTDYRGETVWMTARRIATTNWALLVKIDRAEALKATAAFRNSVVVAIVLLLAALSATVIAVWRSAAARAQAGLAAESGARAQLLSVVTDNQPEPIYIVDEKMNVWFANRRAADVMLSNPKDLRGKALSNVIGNAFARAAQKFCEAALQSNRIQSEMIDRVVGKEVRHIYMQFVPLQHIPVSGLPSPTAGVLIVEKDMNDIIHEREIRLNTLNQLVAMLVSLVDKRDPNAAQHSARVAMLASATARAMELPQEMVETTETAARLMNLGKADIPTEVLTRQGGLNDAERDAIRNSLATSAELLRGIAFNGPVAETLQQAQERVDGSGPLKLKGDEILVSARIVAVANALIGMLSPRAYRPAMSLEEAVDVLQKDVGHHFDRKVISALMHYLDNLEGRTTITRKPEQKVSA